MEAFEQPYHGIQFAIPDDSYYETQDGLSWGVNPTYSHDWNASGVQRDQAADQPPRNADAADGAPGADRAELFQATAVRAGRNSSALRFAEILAEKIRACYQRNKARDIYDLGIFATRPLDQALIRRLVVLKLWQARDTFDPARLMQKFEDGRDFDWDDLRQLLNRAVDIDRDRITRRLRQRFRISRESDRR